MIRLYYISISFAIVVFYLGCQDKNISMNKETCLAIDSNLKEIIGNRCEQIDIDQPLTDNVDKIWIKLISNKARNFKTNPWDKKNIAKALFTSLDLSSFPSSFRPKYKGEGAFFLTDFTFEKVKFSETYLSIINKAWFYKFKFIALADFNGDNTADLLVHFIDDSIKGTYFNSRAIILLVKDGKIIACKKCK